RSLARRTRLAQTSCGIFPTSAGGGSDPPTRRSGASRPQGCRDSPPPAPGRCAPGRIRAVRPRRLFAPRGEERRARTSVLIEQPAGVTCFAEIRVVLELPQHLVADASLVAEPEGGLALDLEQLAGELLVLLARLSASIVLPVGGRKAIQSIAVVLGEVVVDAREPGIVLRTRVFEMRERRFEGDAARIRLL